MKRIALVFVVLSGLAGCAEPARIDQMTAIPSLELPEASSLRHAVELTKVAGGTSTNPLWLSKVGNPEFQAALQTSLRGAGLLAAGAGRYHLDTTLVELHQPFAGFDLTVRSTVRYVLTDAGGKTVFDSPVTVEFTAGLSDAFAAVERLRIANEGSIRKNIQTFMDKLIGEFGKPPVTSQISLRGGAG